MTESVGMGIYVRQKGIDGATISLHKLAKSADVASEANSNLADEVKRTGSAMEAAKRVAAGYFTYAFVKRAIDVADKMTTLRAQIQLVTSSQEEAIAVQNKLLDISNRTYASLEATTTLYTRTARALKDANKSQADYLKFSEAINNAMRLGGVGANEQSNALLQLSQALGSGVLQGDEFRSIAENAPILLDLVAKELGVVRGEVKQLASEGKVTSEVIFNALTNASEQLARDAATMPITVAQALSVANNELSIFADTMLNGAGVTSYMADAIIAIAKNIEFVLVPAVGVGAVMAVRTLAATLMSLGAVGGPVSILIAAMGLLALSWDQNSRKLDELKGRIESIHSTIESMTNAQLAKHKQDIEITISNDHSEYMRTKEEIESLEESIRSLGEGRMKASNYAAKFGIDASLMDNWGKTSKEIENANIKLTNLKAKHDDLEVSLGIYQDKWKEVSILQGEMAKKAQNLIQGVEYSKEYIQILGEIEKKKAIIGVKTLEQTISLKLQGKEYEKMDQLEKGRLITEAANTDLMVLQAQNTETVTGMMEDLRIQAQKTGMGMREAFLFDFASKGATWEQIQEAMALLDHMATYSPTGSGGISSLDHYNDRLQDMSRELSEIISLNKELEATGYASQYNAVSRITLELNDQAGTLYSISDAQKQILIDQAQQIDNANQLNAILNFSNDYSRRFEDMEFELELMGKSRREIEAMKFAYEMEKQAKEMSIGMSRANIAVLEEEIQKYIELYRVTQQKTIESENSIGLGIEMGMQRYIDSVGNLRDQFADATQGVLGHMEGFLVDFATTGKASFSDMTRSILEDISKMMIRMAMMQAVQSAMGLFSGGGQVGGGSRSFPYKAWTGGYIPEYATGGRVIDFSTGGFTGDGGMYEPKGIVHGGEYVMSKAAVNALGIGYLEQLHDFGKKGKGYSRGGLVGGPPPSFPVSPKSQESQQKSGDIVINQTIHYQGDKGEEDGKDAGQDFANGFKTEVRRILADEKRPGGMLYK